MSNPEFALAESVSTTNTSLFIAIYILVLIFCCFGLAIICDVYFVPALQKLSHTYDLPPDIAGSTLMALGASVPELFASLIGVFVTEDDIGTGSIIGSSCFNLIAVPAACAFVAAASFSQKLTISPGPVIRNAAFYAITILVLLMIIKDNKVDIPEGLILLVFFVMYMAFMIFCAQTQTNSGGGGQSSECQLHSAGSLTSSYISSTDSAIGECSEKCHHFGCRRHHQLQNQQPQQQPEQQQVYGQYHVVVEGVESVDLKPTESTPLFGPSKGKDATSTCWTIWTFLVSIALIGALTYVSVWMVHLFGQAVGIPETVAGMTILSWGTGIPELIASIVLIRKTAQADMAICNTIGSNVIDASFCLSLPWIVKCLLNRAEGLKPEVEIQSAALPWTSFTLLLSVVLLILILRLHNWQLGYSAGIWLSLTYVTFVGVATYLESSYAEDGLDLFALI